MKFTRFLALAAGLSAALVAFGQHEHKKSESNEPPKSTVKGELVLLTAKDAAFAAKERANYPNLCFVSDEKIEGGDMGEPKEFIYRETGKPDQLIRFCCNDCVQQFKEDPAKYLKLIAAGKAAKAKPHQEPGPRPPNPAQP